MSSVCATQREAPNQELSDNEEEEGDTDEKIQTSLKRLGNVQRKNRSPLLLKELLGVDGDDAMHGLTEKHLKSLETTKSRLETVRIVNRHFEGKLERRMDLLKKVTELSETKSYPKRNRSWKSQYKESMKKRQRIT